ncbi:MAG: 2-amino-4-hydroxy-6-hydroxymethyldihydropteridine diphosphokinase [Oleibacter sp.]|nr:2-amino-4-hydroxy-6-hydroxymethyldihydropteridine diphosphokinase [Thalassolituus sp.]
MNTAYLGLGANIDDPHQQLITGLLALRDMPDIQLLEYSSFYSSRPLGPQDQPDFVNAVAKISTTLSPLQLLDALQTQELHQGREKRRHWGERCIDFDILLFNDLLLNSDRLTLPHKELIQRSFVVTPLLELTPDLRLPDGQLLAQVHPKFDGDLQKSHRPFVDL